MIEALLVANRGIFSVRLRDLQLAIGLKKEIKLPFQLLHFSLI